MAGDDDILRTPAIPVWQRATSTSESTASPETPSDQHPEAASRLDLLEHARRFLDDESIKNASHSRKEVFLREKGLSEEQIQQILSEPSSTTASEAQGLKTVHESTSSVPEKTLPPSAQAEKAAEDLQQTARITPRSDMPPIITYPEFLLKPQKPPPLVTLERLANAAYALAGLSALTYGASKYLVGPMLESLTSARHDLYSTTKQSLDTLNTKLESSVSHVPYIPPLHSHKHPEHDEDEESIDSDPTELFHRDIATQTSQPASRSPSVSSQSKPSLSAITDQSTHLSSLHTTLSSLLSSTQTHFSETSLQETVSEFQSLITSLEGTSQPLTAPYNPYSLTPSASTIDLTKPGNANTTTTTTLADRAAKTKQQESDSQAAKFKAEIRALKGAFLSSRNFPTVRPAMPFTLPQSAPHQTQPQTQAQTAR